MYIHILTNASAIVPAWWFRSEIANECLVNLSWIVNMYWFCDEVLGDLRIVSIGIFSNAVQSGSKCNKENPIFELHLCEGLLYYKTWLYNSNKLNIYKINITIRGFSPVLRTRLYRQSSKNVCVEAWYEIFIFKPVCDEFGWAKHWFIKIKKFLFLFFISRNSCFIEKNLRGKYAPSWVLSHRIFSEKICFCFHCQKCPKGMFYFRALEFVELFDIRDS